ncbi:8447_t:CDS:1 [Paraglomus occultum]|uniref:8447_t:CDS:1 n=1 Tax=Paraglomus occultum TaxID=144539 RepID=A0A9N8VW94_9GLOM|nr:8447_t:CDS:1 [Paraglomus occultum]
MIQKRDSTISLRNAYKNDHIEIEYLTNSVRHDPRTGELFHDIFKDFRGLASFNKVTRNNMMNDKSNAAEMPCNSLSIKCCQEQKEEKIVDRNHKVEERRVEDQKVYNVNKRLREDDNTDDDNKEAQSKRPLFSSKEWIVKNEYETTCGKERIIKEDQKETKADIAATHKPLPLSANSSSPKFASSALLSQYKPRRIKEVIRGKNERRLLLAEPCVCCRDFYNMIAPVKINPGMTNIPEDVRQKGYADADDLCRMYGRHRYKYSKREPGDWYWDINGGKLFSKAQLERIRKEVETNDKEWEARRKKEDEYWDKLNGGGQ